MIAVFHNIQITARVEGDIIGILELPRRLAHFAPATNQLAVAVEYLDAMIASVGDIQLAVRCQGQCSDGIEPPWFATLATPTAKKAAIGGELADALVFPEFGDVIIAICVLDGVA